MNVKDLRIGDIVSIKSKLSELSKYPRVAAIDSSGDIILYGIDNYNDFSFNIVDIQGCKATNEILEDLGGVYDFKKVEYVFTFTGGLRIAVRPQVGTENYFATKLNEYRPRYCKFTYIHELQHWLWDVYKYEL